MSKKKLNIGIFTYDFFPIFGGMGRHVHELYKQNQLYHDVNMLIFSPSSNSLPNHIQIFPETKKSKLKNIELSIKLNNSFNKFIQQYKLDIVHLQGGPGGFFLFKTLNRPVIYTCHHTYWQQSTYIKEQSWKKIFYYLEKLSYKKADKIICVSKDTMNVLSEHYAINRNNLTYIPNGIDFNPSKALKLITKKSKNILYVGRIDKRKGVDFLVESMKVVNSIDPEITLFVVGEGKDKVRLEQFSKKK